VIGRGGIAARATQPRALWHIGVAERSRRECSRASRSRRPAARHCLSPPQCRRYHTLRPPIAALRRPAARAPRAQSRALSCRRQSLLRGPCPARAQGVGEGGGPGEVWGGDRRGFQGGRRYRGGEGGRQRRPGEKVFPLSPPPPPPLDIYPPQLPLSPTYLPAKASQLRYGRYVTRRRMSAASVTARYARCLRPLALFMPRCHALLRTFATTRRYYAVTAGSSAVTRSTW